MVYELSEALDTVAEEEQSEVGRVAQNAQLEIHSLDNVDSDTDILAHRPLSGSSME